MKDWESQTNRSSSKIRLNLRHSAGDTEQIRSKTTHNIYKGTKGETLDSREVESNLSSSKGTTKQGGEEVCCKDKSVSSKMTIIMDALSIWSSDKSQITLNHSINSSFNANSNPDFVPPSSLSLGMNKLALPNQQSGISSQNPFHAMMTSHSDADENQLPMKSQSGDEKEKQWSLNSSNHLSNHHNNNNNLTNQTLLGVPVNCEGCGLVIEDRFMLQTTDSQCWHEKCLTCAACGCKLDQTCFIRNSQPYCRADYEKLNCGVCSGCEQRIPSNEMVMRVSEHIYHVDCFSCSVCRTVLRTGDQFVLIDDQLYCRLHFEKQFPQYSQPDKDASDRDNDRNLFESEPVSNSNQNSIGSDQAVSESFFKQENSNQEHESDQLKNEPSDNELDSEPKDDSDDEADMEISKDKNASIQQKPCRKRVILTTQQRRAFKAAFDLSSKPCRKVREQLARDTGLSVRVVQVWFQNERAKVKKLAKRQQQQQHNHLESGLPSPHLLDDGQYSVFIPNEAAGFLQQPMDARFSSHLAQSNHIIHPEGGLYALPPGLNDMYPVCSAPIGQPNEADFMGSGSDFQQIMDLKESDIYNSIKLSNQIAHPIDKLYSMQNSYFTSS